VAVRLSALALAARYSPGRSQVLICQRLSRPQGHSAAGRIRSTEIVGSFPDEVTGFFMFCVIMDVVRRKQPMFRRNVPPPFSGPKYNVSHNYVNINGLFFSRR
jgi:hypothetical protein